MKKLLLVLALTTLSFYPSLHADESPAIQMDQASKDNTHFKVDYSLKPDGREWKLVKHKEGSMGPLLLNIQQYIPANESESDPAEFFLVEKMEFDTTISPGFMDDFYKSFTESFNSHIKESYPRSPFDFKILQQDADSILAEFSVNTPELKEQGWFRIIKSEHYNVAVLLYATRKSDQLDKIREMWLSILNKASLTSEKASTKTQ